MPKTLLTFVDDLYEDLELRTRQARDFSGERTRLACCLRRLAAILHLRLATVCRVCDAPSVGEAPTGTREGACAPHDS